MFGSGQGVFGAEGRAFINSSRKFLQWQFLKMYLRHMVLEEYMFLRMMNKIRNVWDFNTNLALAG